MRNVDPSHFELTEFLKQKQEGVEVFRLQKNTAVFLQGDKSNGFFLIHRGVVKLTALSRIGRQVVVAVLKDGDCFGEECLANGQLRATTAIAMHECSVVRVDAEALERLLSCDPRFSRFVIDALMARCLQSQQTLVRFFFASVERRLAQTLLLLVQLENRHRAKGTTLRIGQQALAEMVGASRTRVNQIMNKFRKLGLIHYNHGITIHDSLRRFALRG